MKSTAFINPMFLVVTYLAIAQSAIGGNPPNVVLILSDDQGWQDYGFMGSKVVQTPNLDQLARRSLVFRRGYVVSPLCRPSLASILTGLYPHQHGICSNDVSPARKLERAAENQPLTEAFHRHPSWIRMLVANGYLAFQSGKWWEGSWRDGGFTHGMTHGDHARGGRHGDEGLNIGREGIAPLTEFIDQAVAEEKPFCVWYAPFLPHTPHNPSAELLEKYTQDGRPRSAAKYFAMCDWFDQTCGELLEQLDSRQLTDNTMVVYLADNGWAPRDREAELPDGWWPKFAPRSKASPYEGGIRTPIMVSWPASMVPGEATAVASSLDLMPTVLTACGIQPPKELPGINLLDANARQEREAIYGAAYSCHNLVPGNPRATMQYRWCIRDNWKLLLRGDGIDTTRYKVIHQWDNVPERLYDLKADPNEQKNLASKFPALVQELRAETNDEIPGANNY